VLLGAVVLREALTPTRIIALLLGLGAMALLLGPEIAILGQAPWGSLMLIGSAICWAAATMCFKLVKWTLGSGELAAWQVAFGGIPVIVGAVIIDPVPDFSGLSTTALVGLVYSSTVAVSFGQWIWFRVLELMPAAVAAISTLAIPVIGVFAGAALLGEAVTLFELGALVLVSMALAIVLVGHAGWRALVGKN
jgi:drug/metabolite transporter (DMT)-like permease